MEVQENLLGYKSIEIEKVKQSVAGVSSRGNAWERRSQVPFFDGTHGNANVPLSNSYSELNFNDELNTALYVPVIYVSYSLVFL